MDKIQEFIMYEFLKEPIEDYLKSHQFDDWKWDDLKQNLQVYKLGRNWLIPYYEFVYSNMPLDQIFHVYVTDYTYGRTTYNNYEIHRLKDCDYVIETYVDKTGTTGQSIMYDYNNEQMRLYLLTTIREGLQLRSRRYFRKDEQIDEQIFEERFGYGD